MLACDTLSAFVALANLRYINALNNNNNNLVVVDADSKYADYSKHLYKCGLAA